MTKLVRAIRRFFDRLSASRKPTSGAIVRIRLEELRREQSRRWEIRPPSSECELPLGPHNESAGRTTTQPAKTEGIGR